MTHTPELEDRLRAVMQRYATTAPVPPGMSERLVAGAVSAFQPTAGRPADQARRWPAVIFAATTITLLALVLAAVRSQLFTGSEPATADRAAVPWDASSQQHVTTRQYPATSSLSVPAPAGTRGCVDRDLRLVSADSEPDPSSGWVTTRVTLQSTAAADCSVSAYGLVVVLVDGQGHALPDDAVSTGGGVRRPEAWLVRPKQILAASVVWAHVRGQGPEPAALVILPSNQATPEPGARLSVSLKGTQAPPHPTDPSHVGPWRTGWGWANVTSIADAGSLTSLSATVAASKPASLGQTVNLTVTLANHTQEAVQLAPCPTVTLTLTVVPLKVGFTTGTRGPLNCAAAPRSIAPGEFVRFAAQLAVTNVPNGEGSLVWTLSSEGRPAVSAWTTITVRA